MFTFQNYSNFLEKIFLYKNVPVATLVEQLENFQGQTCQFLLLKRQGKFLQVYKINEMNFSLPFCYQFFELQCFLMKRRFETFQKLFLLEHLFLWPSNLAIANKMAFSLSFHSCWN